MADDIQMEVGGSGTAKVSFKDSFDSDAVPTKVVWASNNAQFSITPVEDDITSAKIFASGAGRATITATGTGENGGTAVASATVVAQDKGALSKGEIAVEVQAAPARAKAPEDEHKHVEDQPKHDTAQRPGQPHRPGSRPLM